MSSVFLRSFSYLLFLDLLGYFQKRVMLTKLNRYVFITITNWWILLLVDY